jgi:DNA modification methylase
MELALEELKGLDDDLLDLTGFDKDLILDKYSDYEVGSIRDRFLVPPFSVLNTREGQWQARKAKWLEIGIKSEEGRSDDLMGKGLTTLSAKQNTEYKSSIALTGTSIFDPVLCELMYLWFAPEHAKIIDPFAGGSVRGIVASKLGHEYMGTELRAEQVEVNREQAKEIVPDNQPIWVADDAKNIKTHFGEIEFDMLMTCPPYADLEVYSDDERDLSTMDHKDFVVAYEEIIKSSTSLLKENTFAVCVVGEVRSKNGKYINFVGDTIKAFEDAGMHYYNEIILVNMIGTLGMRITKQFTSGRKIGKTHQNVLVFWKGEPKAVKNTVSSWDIKGELFSTDEEE